MREEQQSTAKRSNKQFEEICGSSHISHTTMLSCFCYCNLRHDELVLQLCVRFFGRTHTILISAFLLAESWRLLQSSSLLSFLLSAWISCSSGFAGISSNSFSTTLVCFVVSKFWWRVSTTKTKKKRRAWWVVNRDRSKQQLHSTTN